MYIAVGIGGIVGALLRYYAGIWATGLVHTPFPVVTLVINLLGAFLLAWFLTRMSVANAVPAFIRTGFSTGFIGSFTTFSTFSVETVTLLQKGLWGYALGYFMTSALGGLLMAWWGFQLANAKIQKQKDGMETT